MKGIEKSLEISFCEEDNSFLKKKMISRSFLIDIILRFKYRNEIISLNIR